MILPGGNQSPYRLPCSGSVICGSGPRYQHARASEKNIPVFICNTLLPNAYIPPRGDLTPYERFTDNSSGTCQINNCDSGAAPCIPWIGTGGDGTQFDVEFPPPTNTFYQPQMLTGVTLVDAGSGYDSGDQLAVTGGAVSSYLTPDGGSFSAGAVITVGNVSNAGAIQTFSITATGSYKTPPSSPNSPTGGHGTGASFDLTFANQTENLSPCFKNGYKNVQALRQWHGQEGFYFNNPSNAWFCKDFNWWDDGESCNPTTYNPYSLSASQTKYLVASVECDYTDDNTGPADYSIDDTYKATLTVDAESGVIIGSDAAYGCGIAAQYTAGIETPLSIGPFSGEPLSLNSGIADWITAFTQLPAFPFGGEMTPESATCSSGSYSFSYLVVDGDPDPYTGSCSWTITDTSFSATYSGNNGDTSESGNATWFISVSITDDSLTYSFSTTNSQPETITAMITINFSSANTAEDVLTDVYTLLDEWDLTNDAQYPWRTDASTSIAPLVMRNEVGYLTGQGNIQPLDFLGSLFVATATEMDDCKGNAPGDPEYTTTYEYTTTTDPNALLCDGSIIGAPLPAGYQQTFDWHYTDWQSCFDTDSEETMGYIEGWGKLNQGQNGIPRTATNWTSNDLAWQFPGGAWIFYKYNTSGVTCTEPSGSFPPGTVIIAQKWAETKMGFPSENFFRLAGDDKFVYDENHVYTIESITGSGSGAQVELQLCFSCDSPNGSSQPISSISGLWGGPSVNGFYELSSIANGQTVTLGTKVYNVPSDWKSASDTGSGESAYTFGKLRWSNGVPATDPPPILGRAAIANFGMYNGSNTVTELTTVSLPDLGMGVSNADHVDIFDKSMSLLEANAPVTRIDDTHFTVNFGPGSLTNASWLMSNGAPNFAWDDQYPKGDYVYNDFTYWPRLICEANRWNTLITDCDSANCACPNGAQTVYCFPFFNGVADNAGVFTHAFTQTADCISFTPCSPSVLCISPNSEDFDNGTTYDFPTAGGIYLDEQYGSGWIAEFQQVIIDPLWQSPHFPASNTGGCNANANLFQWTMDDGGCEADVSGNAAVKYFPHAPLVEARIAVPNGAPSLPNGISLGWESPAGITANCGSPTSDVLFPPGPIGYGLSAPQPIWSIWGLECDCIAASGRFADQYQNEVIGCT